MVKTVNINCILPQQKSKMQKINRYKLKIKNKSDKKTTKREATVWKTLLVTYI